MEYHQLQLVKKREFIKAFLFCDAIKYAFIKKNRQDHFSQIFYRHQSDTTSCHSVNKSFQIKLCPISLLLYTVRC